MQNSTYKSYAPKLSTIPTPTYSENNVFIMRNLGTVFIDTYTDYIQLLHSSPRTALIDRGKFIDYLGLPKTAHILLIAQPLYKLHVSFDDIINKILIQDRLAYIIIIDSVNVTSWQHLYINRLTAKYSIDIRERIMFFVTTTLEDTLTAMVSIYIVYVV